MAKLSLEELKAAVTSSVTAAKVSNASFVETRDNMVKLLDKIGEIVTIDTYFQNDKLSMFEGEFLSFGKTIEEWQQDLILPSSYDPDGSTTMAPHDPTYRPNFYSYTIGKKVFATTIRYNDIERAVHFEDQFVSIVTMNTKRLQDSEAVYRYQVKREMLGRLIDLCEGEMANGTTFNAASSYTVNSLVKNANDVPGIIVKAYTANDAADWAGAVAAGYIIVLDLVSELALPTTTATGEAFIKQVKKDIEKASDVSEGSSLNGNTLGAVEGLVLIVKQGIIPSLEVDTYAGAFNRGDVAVPAEIVVVKDFGSNTNAYAILMDRRGARLHRTYEGQFDQMNAQGAFMNIYKHTENTAWISRNTFVKVYEQPSE